MRGAAPTVRLHWPLVSEREAGLGGRMELHRGGQASHLPATGRESGWTGDGAARYLADLARWLLWLGVLTTAQANRAHYHMRSTWLPHLVGNTFVLFLPDAVRLIARLTEGRLVPPEPLRPVLDAVKVVVCDRAAYAIEVAPFSLGYILSHPQRTIYKGPLAERRLCGFGLDAIPHAATAFGLVALAGQGLDELARQTPPRAPAAPVVRWASAHVPLVTALVLGLLTLFWEVSEWRIHEEELAEQGGREDRINMMWSPEDTAADVAANIAGWALATALRRWHRAALAGPRGDVGASTGTSSSQPAAARTSTAATVGASH